MMTTTVFVVASEGTTEDTRDYGKAYLGQGAGWTPAEFTPAKVEPIQAEGDDERARFFTALRKASRRQTESK